MWYSGPVWVQERREEEGINALRGAVVALDEWRCVLKEAIRTGYLYIVLLTLTESNCTYVIVKYYIVMTVLHELDSAFII